MFKMHDSRTPLSTLLTQIALGSRLYASWPDEMLLSALTLMGGAINDYVGSDAPPLEGDAKIGYDYVEALKRAAATLTGNLDWMKGTDVPEVY
jgi:hypothetical protein